MLLVITSHINFDPMKTTAWLVHSISDFESLAIAVPSMWFWSVSWSTYCPVFFSIFLVNQKKNCAVSGNLWSVSGNFWSTKRLTKTTWTGLVCTAKIPFVEICSRAVQDGLDQFLMMTGEIFRFESFPGKKHLNI